MKRVVKNQMRTKPGAPRAVRRYWTVRYHGPHHPVAVVVPYQGPRVRTQLNRVHLVHTIRTPEHNLNHISPRRHFVVEVNKQTSVPLVSSKQTLTATKGVVADNNR